MASLNIPNFNFSAFYYGEILDALLAFKRENVPELTDESEFEPSIQLLRAYALVGHLNTTLIDLVAENSTLPTAKLVEVVRNMLRLVDYEMSPAAPSQVDIVYELSKVFTAAFQIVPDDAQAATKSELGIPAVFFETTEALTIDPTDEFSYVYGCENNVFTDYTSDANNQVLGNTFQPVTTIAPNDAIYFGHKHIMWDKLAFVFDTAIAFGSNRVLEFYDGDLYKIAPTSVSIVSSTLEVDLESLLGPTNRQGTSVRVSLNSTSAYEEVESTWNGSENIATVSFLGQTTPSIVANNYTIGSEWSEITLTTDTTSGLSSDGTMAFPVPQTLAQNWIKNEVDGNSAFWLRLRIIEGTGTGATIEYVRLDTGKQYVSRSVTQGKTITDPAISSTGTADQEHELAQDNFIWGSEIVIVDGETWTKVDNFLNSEPVAKHYTTKLTTNDKGVLVFGSGDKGKIPAAGVGNIVVNYRYGAQEDGNVGPNKVVVDKTGLTYINRLWNPRQATGWSEAEGASEESLERTKREAPITVRVKEVALGPDDVVSLTITFVDANGAKPYVRAAAFEEGLGPKTVELVVVASGGGAASQTQLGTLEEYFNGNKYASPPVTKHFVANQEVGAVNYTQKSIDVTATVYGNTTVEAVENELTQFVHPEAKDVDGLYLWDFNSEVPTSKIGNIIFGTHESIKKVVVTVPSSDIELQKRELPIIGTMAITVVLPS